jgi:toxin-antitoxin system PIN domain toxin
MYLLDVNVLLALLWDTHMAHTKAKAWYVDCASTGWATCALTQAGFARVSSQLGFPSSSKDLNVITQLLKRCTAQKSHCFLPLDFTLDVVHQTCTGGLQGHRQMTDAYLLTLAIRNQARLVTFDGGIRSLLASTAARDQHTVVL